MSEMSLFAIIWISHTITDTEPLFLSISKSKNCFFKEKDFTFLFNRSTNKSHSAVKSQICFQKQFLQGTLVFWTIEQLGHLEGRHPIMINNLLMFVFSPICTVSLVLCPLNFQLMMTKSKLCGGSLVEIALCTGRQGSQRLFSISLTTPSHFRRFHSSGHVDVKVWRCSGITCNPSKPKPSCSGYPDRLPGEAYPTPQKLLITLPDHCQETAMASQNAHRPEEGTHAH